jgi:hypothetical protein
MMKKELRQSNISLEPEPNYILTNSNNQESNIEKLASFVNQEDPDLIPVFTALLEMCFNSEKHSLQKF